MRVYHSSGSRSLRVLWLLEELALSYEVEAVGFGAPRNTPQYRALNPLGRVPTLVDGELVLYESGAILQYLLERYGDGRLEPAIGAPQRPLFLQWLHWAEATAIVPVGDLIAHAVMTPEDKRNPKLVESAVNRIGQMKQVLERELAERDYLLSDAFGAADIAVGYTLNLMRAVRQLDEGHPRVLGYLERLAARPAYQKAAAV